MLHCITILSHSGQNKLFKVKLFSVLDSNLEKVWVKDTNLHEIISIN